MDDIENYWPLLKDDGIMCGDDYCEYWQGVIEAVNFNFLPTEIKHDTYQNAEGEAPSDYWMVRK